MPGSVPSTVSLFLERYKIVRLLGEGGMGQAFLCRDLRTGGEVVVKIIRSDVADPRARQRFQREAEVMQRFQHPHAVKSLDAALEGPEPCLVLEYVGGPSLEELLRKEKRLSPDRVAGLLEQLCTVLHAAQVRGILHRDLSAANVRFQHVGGVEQSRPDFIKVLDFGLARSGSGFFVAMEKLSGSGLSIGGGTPDYMCPEQIRGEAVDHRGDIYSVGVLLYQMLTGRLPFADVAEVSDILLAHVSRVPPSFRAVGIVDVPSRVEAIVHRCLAKHPQERPQSYRELADSFAAAVGRPPLPESEWDAASDHEPARGPDQDPRRGLELDRLEAWMPEQIAVMKLRAFVEGVAGEVVDSVPGVIRVRIPDPRQPAVEKPTGLLGFLGIGRRRLREPSYLALELWMEKKDAGGRSQVEIRVVLPDTANASSPNDASEQAMRRGFGERVCRELRAYLMIGR